jgi:hypothetical protein
VALGPLSGRPLCNQCEHTHGQCSYCDLEEKKEEEEEEEEEEEKKSS